MMKIEYEQIVDQLSKSNVLVVGGGGFIGSALCEKLNRLGAHIVSLVRDGTKKRASLPNVTTFSVDIREFASLKEVLTNFSFDYVFNLGGYIDHSLYLKGGRNVVEMHYSGVLNLLDQVFTPSLKRFVQIGSSDEYGNGPSPQSENLREAPFSPYSAAKLGATHLIQALSRTERLSGVVGRLFLVYGPGQDENRFIPQIIRGCLEDRLFPASYGEQLRDFCYIDDVVEGLLRVAVCSKAKGEVFNIASGCPVSIRSVIEQIVSLVGKGKADFGKYPYRQGENMSLYADISRAEKVLDWHPVTSLQEGLAKTISWYRK